MVLVDKKMLVGGIVLLSIGILISINVNSSVPVGHSGMSEEETIDLMVAQQENQDYNTLSGIMMGIGFLLILISFGARRKKNSAKKQEKKPVE
ncbi:MAG TPA: hypothetical protein QF518_04575 [Nitrosopumilus sp.]|jgi:hypothetical protein|nr:hypothetical protein [Nitrosopumilus sp.]HJL67670.1 hypothetical protein [Nitrosopumilus sp.]HJO31884.1 hypothetical protein [Nitrosopumilus sp.]|tara:strand:- start:23302 stop:23580 length:279 start_codon:yes stop_codon:yes gene_type:complete